MFAYKGEPRSVESLLLASAFCWWPLADPPLLVLKLERVRVLLGSHAESGPLAGGGTRNVVKRYCASVLNHGAGVHTMVQSHDYVVNSSALVVL